LNNKKRCLDIPESWKNYETFIAEISPRPTPEHRLCLFNEGAPYSIENTRWLTRKEERAIRAGQRKAKEMERRASGEITKSLLKNTAKKRCGLSSKEYQEMLEESNHRCSICKLPERTLRRGKPMQLSVDHDHETGIIRGILCHSCNAALGHFRDSKIVLASAIEYLDHAPVKIRHVR
jgi:hypothetical protein